MKPKRLPGLIICHLSPRTNPGPFDTSTITCGFRVADSIRATDWSKTLAPSRKKRESGLLRPAADSGPPVSNSPFVATRTRVSSCGSRHPETSHRTFSSRRPDQKSSAVRSNSGFFERGGVTGADEPSRNDYRKASWLSKCPTPGRRRAFRSAFPRYPHRVTKTLEVSVAAATEWCPIEY